MAMVKVLCTELIVKMKGLESFNRTTDYYKCIELYSTPINLKENKTIIIVSLKNYSK